MALLAATFLGMPGGCLLFVPFYHPLHDYFKVPTEVTSVSILMVWTAVVWKFDRISNRYEKPERMDFISKVLLGHLIGHYLVNLSTAILINPEEVVSIGLHETIGNCNETEPVQTILKVTNSLGFFNFSSCYYTNFRSWSVENIFAWTTMTKNITIFIVCQTESHLQMEVFGTLFVEHHSSKRQTKFSS